MSRMINLVIYGEFEPKVIAAFTDSCRADVAAAFYDGYVEAVELDPEVHIGKTGYGVAFSQEDDSYKHFFELAPQHCNHLTVRLINDIKLVEVFASSEEEAIGIATLHLAKDRKNVE